MTKTYGRVHALDQVDLDIRSGEFLTLLGPSGSGKTTLLMVLAGFTRPDSGSLKFGDTEVIRMPPHRRDLGMVFQNYALFPHMTVAGNIAYPLRLRGIGRAEREARVVRALETVQLGGYGGRRIDQLSGGQRQRVALARAIVFEPRILLMDEPLSALDKKLRDRMQIELRHLHEQLGMTTVYVTHDQREALTMSDRIAVIDHGRLMQLGAPREIYDRPANRFVADFIGESAFLPVRRKGAEILCAGRPLATESPAPEGEKLLAILRPERLQLLDGSVPPEINAFPATVSELVYQGDSFLMAARLEDGTELTLRDVVRRDTFAELPGPGSAVTLGLHARDTVLIPDDGAGAAP
ncbi:ABC transporter ATP-binding protein [Paralimibaculum aggregatum]|uniref:Spermidine/putrescine import ATP-binding protein PotA n=2 Tax=Paralimibaculum aggregatum TaxID=3036245 RepID=A0ABQ6LF98_9RHOB|nr:ABC transporter ATP-binding protein [Limibaculum sp. NKW23]